jgi:Polysaccharide pyruvyl transferase
VQGTAKDFLSAVLDKSTKVGVRGEITRRCLAALGFGDEHIEVIGCPSLYSSGRDLSVHKSDHGLTRESRIAANLTLSQVHAAKIMRKAAERYPELIYVPQTINELRMLLWGVPLPQPLDDHMPATPDDPLYRQDRIRFFLDPLVWHRFLADRDFAFGTRVHGNIAALAVGTPAYLLAFDSRTTELADFHAIPYVAAGRIAPDTDVAELYDRADFAAFNQRQPEVFDHYLGFLEKNGLAHVHQPGNENPEFDRRLAEVNFPVGVRSLYAAGPESTAMVLDRLRWLYQGEQTDRERTEAAYEPRPFGPLPEPGPKVERAPAEPKRRPMHRRIKRRVRRIKRRVMRRMRALRG